MTGPIEPLEHIWIVSDVHLDADPDEAARGRSEAFSRFLGQLQQIQHGESGTDNRLVILGDFLNLPNTDLQDARESIDRIAQVHESVFTALTNLVNEGLELVVVPGNHDIGLTVDDVFSVFRRQLATAPHAIGRVQLSPWIYYVPDLLYAEHGNQYHDINRYSTLLKPTYANDARRLHRTSAQWFERIARSDSVRHSELRSTVTSLVALANSLKSHPDWAMPYDDYVSRFVLPYGSAIGIGEPAARDLNAITVGGPISIFRRIATKTAGRLLARLRGTRALQSTDSRDGYLQDAIPGVVEVTRRHGIGVPFYVFGHDHTAGRIEIDSAATYLNAGTWSAHLPASRSSTPESWLTFLRIARSSAELMRWDDAVRDWHPVDI